MGYIHKTPGWAQPLGAKARRTYWGVVPAKPPRTARGLPPHPDDVPLPDTFGDWYDMASAHLGRAEQIDIGVSRLVAGALLSSVQAIGLAAPAGYLAAVLIGGPFRVPSTELIAAGFGLLVVTWGAWAWYRRRWNRAWELRQAWSWAIHEPKVLALPVRPVEPGTERDIDTDPEATHPLRAWELFPLEDRPFEGQVFTPRGFPTDRVRGREKLRLWLLIIVPFLVASVGVSEVTVSYSTSVSPVGTALLLLAVGMLLPVICAWVRFGRRARLAMRLLAVEHTDRRRWTGQRMVSGQAPEPRFSRPVAGSMGRRSQAEIADRHAIAAFLVSMVVMGGIFAALPLLDPGREELVRASWFGVGLIGLTVLIVGMVLVRMWAGRQPGGRSGSGFLVTVVQDRPQDHGDAPVPPWEGLLKLSDGGHLWIVPLDDSLPDMESVATSLISAHEGKDPGGEQWFVLSDGSQLQVECSDHTGLRDAAEAAGLRVVRPGYNRPV